ncbi:hypothetical protein [Pseudoxanthomonas wuyuanensis]|uniref:Uncharacterized protein n=1 Tax=Pseudoxanthomonas wuyuanensis TaxID=1073196 RepID=A0A286DEM7_9GAMM|nr:hypothetical protein [Pseudoxanthomonas wuyuanensis]KAF1719870.1 hypothetical protein CSC75_13175 [Pseudoxanthomonas wuyuanensis]SOD57089.1 hypothetical protein SAMN06296416_11215 [Pseudoxanthomonas wuyuanensis]
MESRYLLRLVSLIALTVASLQTAWATPRMTRFDPATHGFRFVNTFNNDVIREVDFRTSGLCGGMVYSAMDYFNASMPIPQQAYRPAVNTPLHDYIYKRQVASLTENMDKWAELGFNPLGARNGEFFRWGLQGFSGGRLQELRARIDRGQPAPLGLWHYDGARGGDHQVLAIGYDLGRYRGDLGAHQEDLRIFVYDPNYPGRTLTLVPDLSRGGYRYLEEDKLWLTYFVDAKYRAQRPSIPATVVVAPADASLVRELLVTIETGGDDLRGGNDNVDLVLNTRSGRQSWRNANGGRRWLGNYSQTLSLPVRNTRLSDLRSLDLLTHFGGGIGGDNWNVDCVIVYAVTGDNTYKIYEQRGAPLVRFTGQVHSYTASFDVPGRFLRLKAPLKLDASKISLPPPR